jgi:hypothetical protein
LLGRDSKRGAVISVDHVLGDGDHGGAQPEQVGR